MPLHGGLSPALVAGLGLAAAASLLAACAVRRRLKNTKRTAGYGTASSRTARSDYDPEFHSVAPLTLGGLSSRSADRLPPELLPGGLELAPLSRDESWGAAERGDKSCSDSIRLLGGAAAGS